MLGKKGDLPEVATFHSFCFKILKSITPDKQIRLVAEKDRVPLVKEAMLRAKKKGLSPAYRAGYYLDAIVKAKQNLLGPGRSPHGKNRKGRQPGDKRYLYRLSGSYGKPGAL